MKIFDLCNEYQLKFSRTDPVKVGDGIEKNLYLKLQKQKVGKAICLFGTAKEAQNAYTILSAGKIDGQPIRIEIAENFGEFFHSSRFYLLQNMFYGKEI